MMKLAWRLTRRESRNPGSIDFLLFDQYYVDSDVYAANIIYEEKKIIVITKKITTKKFYKKKCK